MKILIEGLYTDKVLNKAIELSTKLNMEFVNCATINTFEDYITMIREHPDAIIFNTWINYKTENMNDCSITTEQKIVLENMLRIDGSFAYYMTSRNIDKMKEEFGEDKLKTIDYEMTMLKMSIPVIAVDCSL